MYLSNDHIDLDFLVRFHTILTVKWICIFKSCLLLLTCLSLREIFSDLIMIYMMLLKLLHGNVDWQIISHTRIVHLICSFRKILFDILIINNNNNIIMNNDDDNNNNKHKCWFDRLQFYKRHLHLTSVLHMISFYSFEETSQAHDTHFQTIISRSLARCSHEAHSSINHLDIFCTRQDDTSQILKIFLFSRKSFHIFHLSLSLSLSLWFSWVLISTRIRSINA